MKKIVRLTESELTKLIKRVISESSSQESVSKIKKEVESIKNKKVPGSKSIKFCAVYLFQTGDLTQKESENLFDSCTDESWGYSCASAFAELSASKMGALGSCLTSCLRTGKYDDTVCKPDNARF